MKWDLIVKLNSMYKSNLKAEIAKRYTITYTLNKWREAISEYLWLATAIFLGFFTLFYFGGHIMAQCLINQ